MNGCKIPHELAELEGAVEVIKPRRTARRWCVYFLVDVDVVVYVGISSQVTERVQQHLYSKEFTHMLAMPVAGKKEAREIEMEWIWKIKPKYNRQWQLLGGRGNAARPRQNACLADELCQTLPHDVRPISDLRGISTRTRRTLLAHGKYCVGEIPKDVDELINMDGVGEIALKELANAGVLQM